MIVLVRHGRTEANASGRLLGRLDPDLDDVGRSQAAAIGTAVAGAARIVTSPLVRARQTADALGLDVRVEVDRRWVELDYGVLDGVAIDEVPPSVWATWRRDVHWSPEGGESLASLGARVRAACGELVEEAGDRDIVVVTHVSPIKAAVAWALGVGDEIAWRLYVAPASITRIAVSSRGAALHSFNDIAHL